MHAAGTRRELLTALLGAAAGGMGACTKPRSLGVDGGFVDPSMRRGHALRSPPRDAAGPTERLYASVVILGGGVSGLAAAWQLMRRGFRDLAILDLEDRPGGTSVGGVGAVCDFPWGAHYLPAPRADQPDLLELLEEMGVAAHAEGHWRFAEGALCAWPQERVFAAGLWQPGLVPEVGAAPGASAAIDAFRRRMRQLSVARGVDGRRAFALPVGQSSRDPAFLALDGMSFSDWLDHEGFVHPDVRWLADYATRDDFGATPETTSAWFGVHYHAARLDDRGRSAPFLTWPEGNHRFVKHFMKRLSTGPAACGPRFVGGRLVRRVRPHPSGRGLEIEAHRAGGTVERWFADRAIYALPSFMKGRILEGFARPWTEVETSPWLVANLHLKRRPVYVGSETAWDNVIQDSRSLGYVVATHQLGPPAGPTVWTWYLPIAGEDPRRAREQLHRLSWREGADLVLSDLERAHPDLRRCVTRIDLRRWGHAMPRPEPGLHTSSALARARTPVGGLSFAHTDLSAVALFEEAFAHGVRAADEASRGLSEVR